MVIERAAFLGFALAQVEMGLAYELCHLGCEYKPDLFLHYNILAAAQDEQDAEMAVSKWFLSGADGYFEKSEAVAYIYAHRAALHEHRTAIFALGYFNENGIHVPVKERHRLVRQSRCKGGP